MKKQELRQIIKEEISEILGKNLSNRFNIGNKVKVNDREMFEDLIGLTGIIVDKSLKKGMLGVDFGKEINGDGFATHDLNGILDTNTGLLFFDNGWISSKIDPRFDIRNLTKL